MFPGMGGMNPKNIERMMKQLGIKSEELNARKVIFELDGKKLVIDNPSVTAVEMQGKKTYTVMGETREESAGIPEEDIELVAVQTGKSKEEARKALEETNGDIAEAITKLNE